MHTVNGIGTHACGGYAPYRSDRKALADGDNVACFVLFYLPIFPYQFIHTFNRKTAFRAETFQQVRLKKSWRLLLHAYLRNWSFGLILGGAIATGGYTETWLREGNNLWAALAVGAIFAGVFGLIYSRLMWYGDQRIRIVMGQHALGSSDPATWAEEVLQNIVPAQELFQQPSYEAAARKFQSSGEYAKAMFAARICLARESSAAGLEITEQLLAEPLVQDLIKEQIKEYNLRSIIF